MGVNMSKKINLTILVSIILCVLFSCVSNKNAEVVNTPVTPPVQEETQNIQKLILEGRTTEAKELFQAKIDINEMDENGNTALHTAARINEADLVTFLIYKGANVELKNHDGDTPLHIAIKNNASEKEYQLDLEELIKNFPLEDKAKLRAIIQQLPGEVLADIAVELDSSFTNADETFSSVHVVNILRKVCGVCNAEACYSVRTNSVDTTARESTIVHELGHAVDYNGIDKNISSIINNEEFNNIFKEEMNAYLAAGHTRYNSKVGDFDNCYFREGGGRYSSKYATYDEQEMFAECYAMLMTGECKSRDLIEDFFPKTLQVIAKHIEYVRSLPDDVRCASRN